VSGGPRSNELSIGIELSKKKVTGSLSSGDSGLLRGTRGKQADWGRVVVSGKPSGIKLVRETKFGKEGES